MVPFWYGTQPRELTNASIAKLFMPVWRNPKVVREWIPMGHLNDYLIGNTVVPSVPSCGKHAATFDAITRFLHEGGIREIEAVAVADTVAEDAARPLFSPILRHPRQTHEVQARQFRVGHEYYLHPRKGYTYVKVCVLHVSLEHNTIVAAHTFGLDDHIPVRVFGARVEGIPMNLIEYAYQVMNRAAGASDDDV